MFERTLQDVVKGLRAQPTSEGRNDFASLVLQECKKELASTDVAIKAQAVLKVAHLRMLGYDDRNYGDDDTSFHVIETMASQPFKQKRIGYLAASTLLTADSPLLLLATNSLKKEMQSTEVYAVGLALGSTSSFTSRELARDLLPDVISATTSSIKPYVRKRGTLCLYRLCTRYPEALKDGAYDALRSRLDDSDPAVISCAVNAVCELAKANPRNVLPLTPQLFQLLTTSGNNWLTIKVVKLYSSLITVEPRLAKKLLDPLAHIVKTTTAKSLLFECISTVTRALRYVVIQDDDGRKRIEQVVNLCATKLKEFVKDTDQNLKYLGLVGFVELTKSYPTVAQEHKDLVLLCLNDEDVTVRLRALELLAGMANKTTVAGVVSRLLEHLANAPPGRFRDAVVQTCVDACSDEDFHRVPSCEWYMAVLMDLARLGKGAHGSLLARQIVSVPMRVQSARGFAANSCTRLLLEQDGQVAPEILAASAFVACEYFDPNDPNAIDTSVKLIEQLLGGDETEGIDELGHQTKKERPLFLPPVRAVFITNAFKLASKVSRLDLAIERSNKWVTSESYRVRERVAWCRSWSLNGDQTLFRESAPLGPVHVKAQKRVPPPPGLDLSVRRCERPTQINGSKMAISFRGIKTTMVEPYMASTSGPTKLVSFGTNPYSPFKVQDTSAFMLGKSDTIKSKRKTKVRSRSKQESDDDDGKLSSAEEDNGTGLTRDENVTEKLPSRSLWSSDLLRASTSANQGSMVIMTPAALPPGALSGGDDEKNLVKKPHTGQLTLADVDVMDEYTDELARESDKVLYEAKPSKSSKKKDKEEKKEKKKKKSSKNHDKSEAAVTPILPPDNPKEQDLLDFSEL